MWMSRDRGSDVVCIWDAKPELTSGVFHTHDTLAQILVWSDAEHVTNAPRRGQCVEIDGPPRVEVTVKQKAKKGAKAK